MFRKLKAKKFDGSLTAKYCIGLLRNLQKDKDVKEIHKTLEKVENIKIPSNQVERSNDGTTLYFMTD